MAMVPGNHPQLQPQRQTQLPNRCQVLASNAATSDVALGYTNLSSQLDNIHSPFYIQSEHHPGLIPVSHILTGFKLLFQVLSYACCT